MSSELDLTVAGLDTDWGGASPENIRAVCLSVAECFDPAIAEKPVEPIRIEPTPSTLNNPRTVFERAETGHVRILLSARETKWAKLAYQFAHEFLHVLGNIPKVKPPLVSSSEWIEESLAEMSSLFALRAMARGWCHCPPYPNWASYAPAFQAYAEEILTDPKYQIPSGESYPEWLKRSLPALRQTPYRREENAVLALRLLPLFEADANDWCAVRYLNCWNTNDDLPFDKYFDTWRSVTPVQHHGSVDRIERCLMRGTP